MEATANETKTCQNNTGSEQLMVFSFYTYKVVFPVLIVLGVFCNVINIVVLTRPQMRSRIYRWLRMISFADLGLCMFLIPVCLADCGNTTSSYSLAKYYSMFAWTISASFQSGSFYLMVWFAHNRYLAVCCHERYPKSLRREVYLKRLIGTALFVLALHIPTMFFGEVCEVEEGVWMAFDGYRHVDNRWYEAYSWLREILSRITPAILITFFNCRILMRVRELQSIREGFASEVVPSRREKERWLVILLFWATVGFYIYQTPVTIYLLLVVHPFGSEDHREKILLFGVCSNIIQMLGNVSNFTLYFLINPQFHKTFKGIFCRSKSFHLDESDRDQISEFNSQHQSIHPSLSRKVVVIDGAT